MRLRMARRLSGWRRTWGTIAPDVVPYRIDRLRACGNGVVPLQATVAFVELFIALEVRCEDASRGNLTTEDDDMGRGETHGGGGPSDKGDKDETRTPLVILNAVEAVLGPIEFDPCAHPRALITGATVVLLERYRGEPCATENQIIYGDGLLLDWSGRGLVWVNMPYSDIEPWAAKRHEADEVCFFPPVRTANKWWARTFDDADAICFLYDRVKHVGHKAHADFHQCLVYYGPRVRTFYEGLHGKLGRVYVHERHWGWT